MVKAIKNKQAYQLCVTCVMDTTDANISFNEQGECMYCQDANKLRKNTVSDLNNQKVNLESLLAKIKRSGEGKPYDCLMGLSGGVDSSYVTYQLYKFGLRVLVVHMDNGWDSELSVMNIENILRYTGFDLYTNVLNWKEFRQMQVAYLKAGVLDLEALSDHAINATIFNAARKFGIKYVITGSNPKTESILPLSWRYDPKLTDSKNIFGIVKKVGGFKPKYFPTISLVQYLFYIKVLKIELIAILEYLDFDKGRAMNVIKTEMGWRDYVGKHYESIITRFYQGYILPNKFYIDKRRAHLSSLIIAGQITREEALRKLEEPILEPQVLRNDLEYVPKKLKLTSSDFQEIMDGPIRDHLDFPSNKLQRKIIFGIGKLFKGK